MYKATAGDIKWLIDNGKDVAELFGDKQPSVHEIAWYSAPSWNWAYKIGLVKVGGIVYEVVTQFGEVKGGRKMWLPEYDNDYLYTPEYYKKRLDYLRGEIEAENISTGEIAELQELAEHIDPSDTLLLQWADVPEWSIETIVDAFYELYGQHPVYDNSEYIATGHRHAEHKAKVQLWNSFDAEVQAEIKEYLA